MLAEWKVKEKRIAKHSAEEQSSAFFCESAGDSFLKCIIIVPNYILKCR